MSNLSISKLISLINKSNANAFFEYLLGIDNIPSYETELIAEIELLEMAGMTINDIIKATCFVIHNHDQHTGIRNGYLILKTPQVFLTTEGTFSILPHLIKATGIEHYYITAIDNDFRKITKYYSQILDDEFTVLDY